MIQHFHSGHALKRTESWISKRYLCTHFHSSVTHNSWNPGATNVSVNGWIEKQKCGIYIQRSATAVYTTAAYYSGLLQRYIHTVVYTYSGLLQRSATVVYTTAAYYSGIYIQWYIHTAVYTTAVYYSSIYYSGLLQRSATVVYYSSIYIQRSTTVVYTYSGMLQWSTTAGYYSGLLQRSATVVCYAALKRNKTLSMLWHGWTLRTFCSVR